MPRWQLALVNFVLKDAIYGAYTELFAGLSPNIKPEMNGAWGKSLSPGFEFDLANHLLS
jgi:hypothetical protein